MQFGTSHQEHTHVTEQVSKMSSDKESTESVRGEQKSVRVCVCVCVCLLVYMCT